MIKFVFLPLILKILIALLCLYFVGIVSLPCQDSIGGEINCEKQDNCKDETEGHKECQPFCNCACCSSVFIEQLVSIDLIVPHRSENSIFHFVLESSSKFLPSIWQPPKIG
jgi:hypothetical protein